MEIVLTHPGWYGLILLFWAHLSCGQGLESTRSVQYSVQYTGRVDYDSYFGFYPTLSASLTPDSLHELTGYASYYTNPAFLGLETGLSVGFSSARRNWLVTPGFGLVSGSMFVSEQSFVLAEGFVGTFSLYHEGATGFVQGYAGYYGAWKRLMPWTYDFLYASVQAGRTVSKYCRLSLTYEQLANIRLPRNRFDTTEFNVPRLGMATDIQLPHGFTTQAAAGWTRNDSQWFFFRISLSRSLSGPAPVGHRANPNQLTNYPTYLSHELGIFGPPGVDSTKQMIQQADAILAFGVDTLKPFLTDADNVQRRKLIQCEADFNTISLEYGRTQTLVGPLQTIANELAHRLTARSAANPLITDAFIARQAHLSEMAEQGPSVGDAAFVHPAQFLDETSMLLLDTGAYTVWAARYLQLAYQQPASVSAAGYREQSPRYDGFQPARPDWHTDGAAPGHWH